MKCALILLLAVQTALSDRMAVDNGELELDREDSTGHSDDAALVESDSEVADAYNSSGETEDICDSGESLQKFAICAICKSAIHAPACTPAGLLACTAAVLATSPIGGAVCVPIISLTCNQLSQKISEFGEDQIKQIPSARAACQELGFCDKWDSMPEKMATNPDGFCNGCARLVGLGTEKCKWGAQTWCKTRRDGIFSLKCVPK